MREREKVRGGRVEREKLRGGRVSAMEYRSYLSRDESPERVICGDEQEHLLS